MSEAPGRRRRLLIPETIQSSAMDCGPAALRSLLAGFHIQARYGRLREVCSTDVDGTSIESLVELARGLGLDAEEALVPPDHLLSGDAGLLPAIAVVRTPLGRHFVVLWRRHGGRLQVMDPAVGRRWLRPADLAGELHIHRAAVPAAAWRQHGVTPAFLGAVDRALRDIGAAPPVAAGMVRSALGDPSWRSLASLDAASRLGRALVAAGAVRPGPEALARTVERFERARAGELGAIPEAFWSIRPRAGAGADAALPIVEMSGAVILRVAGRRAPGPEPIAPRVRRGLDRLREAPPPAPGLRDALTALAGGEGRLGPGLLAGGLVLAAAMSTLEIVLLRRLYDVAIYLGLERQRLGMLAAFVALALGMFLVELQVAGAAVRLGRRLEGRIRIALLERLPRLGDRYFRSRLTSDLAQRIHNAHLVRRVPQVGMEVARRTFQILFALVGLCWLAPATAPLALAAALAAVAVPLLAQRVLTERSLRQQTLGGALGRHYLDLLLGLTAIRTHGGQRAARREHGRSLFQWIRAGHAVARASASFEASQSLLGVALAAALIAGHVRTSGEVLSGGFLIVVFWAVQIPALGGELATTIRGAVPLRGVTVRLLDPLRAEVAPDARAPEDDPQAHPDPHPQAHPHPDPHPQAHPHPHPHARARAGARSSRGVDLCLDGVTVSAGGRDILRGVDLTIPRGAQVAIVGVSGSGKSTLIGALMGWFEPAQGRVLVDGHELDAEALAWLRPRTTWVDPSVQLWNRSLLDNLAYGGPAVPPVPIGRVLEEAELLSVLERLPGGLQAPIGEGGCLLSGGDGQRVRLARGLLRGAADLVLLDEPFRGLDRAQRAALLERARRWWRGATLLCVTHDVGETVSFSRVLVVEGGAIVEDGHPQLLMARPGSRYRALLDAERALRADLWRDPSWRQVRFEGGRVRELADGDGASDELMGAPAEVAL